MEEEFTLPDGSAFKIPKEIEALGKCLFTKNPAYTTVKKPFNFFNKKLGYLTVDQILHESFDSLNENMIDVSIFDNIIMCGGNSNTSGFTEALQHAVIPFAREYVRIFDFIFF